MNFKRALVYPWAFPATAIGLLLAAAGGASGGSIRLVDGVLEAHGGCITTFLRRGAGVFLNGGTAAMTLGHVVLGVDADALERTRDHERVHVCQYERWGPLFLPAYATSSLLAWLAHRDPYLDNHFEREAYGNS